MREQKLAVFESPRQPVLSNWRNAAMRVERIVKMLRRIESLARDNNEPVVVGTGFNSSLTRRAFFVLVGQAAIVVSLGGFLRFLERKHRFIRPPGALAEEEFLSLCIKCQKCQEICPTRTITSALLTESAVSVGTPRLNFRVGYCNLCLKCIEACPTGALQPTKKEAVRLGVAQVDKERCVASTWAGCTQCQQACPLGAISLDNNQRPTVDTSRCNGCGLCEYVCLSPFLSSYTSAGGKGIVVVPMGI